MYDELDGSPKTALSKHWSRTNCRGAVELSPHPAGASDKTTVTVTTARREIFCTLEPDVHFNGSEDITRASPAYQKTC
jgi:hypothetical protein